MLLLDKFSALLTRKQRPLANYSDLDAPIGKYVFGNQAGDLCTLLKINGNKTQPVGEIFSRKMAQFAIQIEPSLRDRAHVIHSSLDFDPSVIRLKNYLDELMRPNREAARRIGLDLEWLFDKKAKKLAEYGAIVGSYLAVWTRSSGSLDDERFENAGPDEVHGLYSQTTWNSHLAFVQAVESALRSADISANHMNVYEAIHSVRELFNAEETPPNYKPKLKPDDLAAAGVKPEGRTLFLPPALRYQVTPGKVTEIDFDHCQVGSRIYGSFDFKYFPSRHVTFETLMVAAASKRLPFRYALRLGSGPDLSYRSFASSMSLGPEKDAHSRLTEFLRNEGTAVTAQASIVTWVDHHEADSEEGRQRLLQERTANLRYVVKSWGGAELDSKGIDPVEQLVNTIPGFRFRNTAPVSLPPLHHAAPLQPLFKTSRIWENTANSVYRNSLGEIIPVKRFSKEQPYNMTLIQGEPGSGKSNHINDMILTIACDPSVSTLPYIGVVDIKPSSFGAFKLLQEALPAHLRHQVQMITLTNDAEHGLNPNDTLYGARSPTQAQYRAQKAFWSILCQPIHANSVLDEVSRTIDAILKTAFRVCSDMVDNNNPKRYRPGEDRILDSWLEEERFEAGADTTYWDIFDYFHDQNQHGRAAYAQTFAVPNLTDMINISRDVAVTSATEGLYVNGQPAYEYVGNLLVALAEKYPVFAGRSRINTADARCISIDIRHLVKGSQSEEAQLSAATYILAMHIVTQNFRVNESDLHALDQRYHDFHKKRIAETKTVTRTAIFDEMHKINPEGESPFASLVQQEIITNIREEARAEAIEYIVASQLADDFQGAWKELYQTSIILDTSEGEATERTIAMYDLPEGMDRVISSLGPPTRHGSSFLLITKSRRGRHIQKCFCTLPPEQLWGTTTTKADVLVKEAMIKKMGSLRKALEVLSTAYPGGKAADKREQFIRELGGEASDSDLTEKLVEFAYQYYKEQQ